MLWPIHWVLDSLLLQSLCHTLPFANMIGYKTCKANDFKKQQLRENKRDKTK